MKNHKEILQGSLEWHGMRWGKISGTLSSGLFVKSDTLLIDILSQRLEEFEPTDSYENYDMQRGKELEPFAIEFLNQYAGVEFKPTGWLQCEENELLGFSPDGITDDETIQCEIKCFARKKHLSTLLADEIPLDNINQLVHAFVVNPKLDQLHFFCFRPEAPKHFHKVLTRESEVNLGTKAKPVINTIAEWCKIERENADLLLAMCLTLEAKLNEI